MRPYNGFEPKLSGGARAQLPAGGYVARVKNAYVEGTQWGDRLVIEYDVAEGEQAGFFQRDYEKSAGTAYQKWRGVFRANVPDDSETDFDNISKNVMNNTIAAFQTSNPGYEWNWAEATLKGLIVGVLIREKEWEKDGRTGWTTECCKLTDANLIRSGDFEMPAPKPLKKSNNGGQNGAGAWTPPPPSDADAPPPRGSYPAGAGLTPPGGGPGWEGSAGKLPWE